MIQDEKWNIKHVFIKINTKKNYIYTKLIKKKLRTIRKDKGCEITTLFIKNTTKIYKDNKSGRRL